MNKSTANVTDAALSRQKRGTRIALTAEEIDEFLAAARTCRVATISNGRPHVSPLWFAWHDGSLWLYSIATSQRFRDITKDPAVAVVIDDGHDFRELRGVEILGDAVIVGEVPRNGVTEVPELVELERLYARKYQDRDDLTYDGRHAWIRITPQKMVTWNFRKMPVGR